MKQITKGRLIFDVAVLIAGIAVSIINSDARNFWFGIMMGAMFMTTLHEFRDYFWQKLEQLEHQSTGHPAA